MRRADSLSRLIARNAAVTEHIVLSYIEAEVNQVLREACRTLPVTDQLVEEWHANDPLE